MLSESGLIADLKTQFPSHIGDDAAVFGSPLPHHEWVITQDILIEDVHFRRRYHDAASLAQKALEVNLSDLAAMGATARFILLAIAIPSDYHAEIATFITQFTEHCHDQQLILIGGDTTGSKAGLCISVTAIGEVASSMLKYRHTAMPHQILCVAGHLGYAHVGLTALEVNHPGLERFKHHFLYPKARLAEGRWLAQRAAVTAMMDLSDGLVTDLQKLITASQIGVTIDLEALSPKPHFLLACNEINIEAIEAQLIGGEDFGLLCCIESNHYSRISADFQAQFNYPLQRIGVTKTPQTFTFEKNGNPVKLTLKPFEHFE